MYKKLIAFVLCFAMIFSMTCGAFAEEHVYDGNMTYVCIGSSQTYGYGLPGSKVSGSDKSGFQEIIANSFPYFVKQEIEENQNYKVDLRQLSISGMRTNDLLIFLDENWQLDEYSNDLLFNENLTNVVKKVYPTGTTQAAIASMRAIYQDAIKEADLITYDLGANNFGGYILQALMSNYDTPDYSKIFTNTEYALYKVLRKAIEYEVDNLLNQYHIPSSIYEKVEPLIDIFAYTTVGYYSTFDKTMEYIYSHNEKDVKVVVMQIQNFVSGIDFEIEGYDLPLDEFMSIPITLANAYASSGSRYASKYYYARITDNQRVEFIRDELLEYDGKTSEEIAKWERFLDYSDSDISIAQMASENYISEAGFGGIVISILDTLFGGSYYGDYSKYLDASHDAVLRFMQYVMSNYGIALTSSISEGGKASTSAIMKQLVCDVYDDLKAEKENGYDDAIQNSINTFESLPKDVKAQVIFCINLGFGKIYLVHPNENGHKEMADAVVSTLTSNVKGIRSIAAGVNYTLKDLTNTTKNLAGSVDKNIQITVNNIDKGIQSAVKNAVAVRNQIVNTVRTNIKNFFTK